MPQSAITVENISKVYRLGVKAQAPDTLASALAGFVRAPGRNLRRLRSLARFAPDEDSPDILWALKDVSFEVKEGEVLGVIGRNGAGKSTLLKILSRITEPTSGRATIRGRLSSLLEVGTGFHPELTGRDNIYMNGTILGMTKREIDRKFEEIVDFSGIEKFLDTPVKRYSSGMQVRLAFAVAAHLEPEILIIDEVLAVGDADFQKKCVGKMEAVAKGGRTVLFVSHNLAIVRSLCESSIVLNDGKVDFLGPCKNGCDYYVGLAATATSANCDLGAHSSRRRGSPAILRRLRICDGALRETSEVGCGDSLVFGVTLAPDAGQNCDVGIMISDSHGHLLTTIGTFLADVDRDKLPPGREWLCRVDSLPLSPGRYYISLRAGHASSLVSSDILEQCGAFDVAPQVYFNGGKLPRADRGPLLIRAHWSSEMVEPLSQQSNAAVVAR